MLRTALQQRYGTVRFYIDFIAFPGKNVAKALQWLEKRFSSGNGDSFPRVSMYPLEDFFFRKKFLCL